MTSAQIVAELKRRLKNTSQRQLAEELDVSAAYICKILSGDRQPGRKIAEALGLRRVVAFK